MAPANVEESHWEKGSYPSDHIEEVKPSRVVVRYPNRWARLRAPYREYIAEFLGTALILMFGDGVVCQMVLSSDRAIVAGERGSWLSLNFGWAAGVAIGVWASGGISGGHLNPAVTLALATWRGFPWRKVPGYMLAQVLGALVGAAIVYANYHRAIDIFEDGQRTMATAGLFATYALPYVPSVGCFFEQVIATALLLLVVVSMGDQGNMPVPAGLAPLVLFIALLGIGTSFGMQTGYAINPARDLGPRMFTAMAGYGKGVFTFRHHYWIWCPIIGPFVGAQLGVMIYDCFLYEGEDSIVNRPDAAARQLMAQDTERNGCEKV